MFKIKCPSGEVVTPTEARARYMEALVNFMEPRNVGPSTTVSSVITDTLDRLIELQGKRKKLIDTLQKTIDDERAERKKLIHALQKLKHDRLLKDMQAVTDVDEFSERVEDVLKEHFISFGDKFIDTFRELYAKSELVNDEDGDDENDDDVEARKIVDFVEKPDSLQERGQENVLICSDNPSLTSDLLKDDKGGDGQEEGGKKNLKPRRLLMLLRNLICCRKGDKKMLNIRLIYLNPTMRVVMGRKKGDKKGNLICCKKGGKKMLKPSVPEIEDPQKGSLLRTLRNQS